LSSRLYVLEHKNYITFDNIIRIILEEIKKKKCTIRKRTSHSNNSRSSNLKVGFSKFQKKNTNTINM